jgi:hypothetical protein
MPEDVLPTLGAAMSYMNSFSADAAIFIGLARGAVRPLIISGT